MDFTGIEFLTVDEVLHIHAGQIERSGGEHGLRDADLLETILATPKNWIAYECADETERLPGSAACYLHRFSLYQCFVDGNKRTGAVSAIAFLRKNGYDLDATNDELHDVTLNSANKIIDRDEIHEWIQTKIVSARPRGGAE